MNAKKLGIILGAVALILAGGAYLSTQRTSHNAIPQDGSVVTLRGERICLPHKNTSGPQTLECAMGFKDNNGNNYSLVHVSDTSTGAKITEVTGKFTKQSSDRYDTVGILDLNPSVNQQQSNSTTETANWETYTSTEFGFSFKYPTQYVLDVTNITKQQLLNSVMLIQYGNTKDADGRLHAGPIWFQIAAIPQPFTYQHAKPANKIYTTLPEAIEHYGTRTDWKKDGTPVTFGSLSGLQLDIENSRTAYVLSNTMLYEIRIGPMNNPLAKQIYDTLSFSK